MVCWALETARLGYTRAVSLLEHFVANMSVVQLAEAVGLSVEQVARLVLSRAGPQTHTKAPSKPSRAKGASPKKARAGRDATGRQLAGPTRNTRTAAGRATLERAILEFLRTQTQPVRALDIRQAVGGTAAQIRTRLNALIDDDQVAYKGRARGTRYRAKR